MSIERPPAGTTVAAVSEVAVPAVSVIIPAYGVTQYISATLDSVFAQSFRDFEIVVVNDGCPDSAALEAVLRPYRERIVYLRKENGGPASARNAGIRAARAALLALLDSDDLWEQDFLAVQTAYLRAHPHVDIVYCDGTIFGDTPLVGRTWMEFSPSQGEVTFESLALARCCIPTCSVVARKAVLLAAGGFDEGLRRAEDLDLWLRAAHGGATIHYHRRALWRYRRRGDGLTANQIAQFEAGLQVVDKLERTLTLSSAEKAALESRGSERRFERAYHVMKEALRRGNARDALAATRELLRLRWDTKFALLALALRAAPRLTVRAAHRRDR